MSDTHTEKEEKVWEKELIRDLLFNAHKTQVSDQRWRLGIKLLRTLALVMLLACILTMSLTSKKSEWSKPGAESKHTAYINIYGEISSKSASSADKIIPAIRKAFENANSVAVVLRINSPGGSPVHSGRIYEEINVLKRKHPSKRVYAVIDDIGASGGYYIAAAADEIYADKASLVGSIGVISAGFGFSELLKKHGIERRLVTAGANKSFLDPFSPQSADAENFWRSVLEKTHVQFISSVKKGRGARIKDSPEIFSGLLWNGEQAKDLGLIDGFGSLDSLARDIIKEPVTVNYTPPKSFLKSLTQSVKVEAYQAISEFSNTSRITTY